MIRGNFAQFSDFDGFVWFGVIDVRSKSRVFVVPSTNSWCFPSAFLSDRLLDLFNY